jgi:hypothetical protein
MYLFGGDAADIATGIPGPEVTINSTNGFNIFSGGDSADNATALHNNNIPGPESSINHTNDFNAFWGGAINNANDLCTFSGGDAADVATGIPGPEVTINTTNGFNIFSGGDSADNATALHNNNIPGPESAISPAAAAILNATRDSSSFSTPRGKIDEINPDAFA